jgi:hypothetical protein
MKTLSPSVTILHWKVRGIRMDAHGYSISVGLPDFWCIFSGAKINKKSEVLVHL